MEHPTVQDIFLRFYPGYLDKYTPSPQQAKVANCIINCKTGAYGANVSMCEDCGHLQIHYNSCRNRCCPMCQALPKEKWMDKRREGIGVADVGVVGVFVAVELPAGGNGNGIPLLDGFGYINVPGEEGKVPGAV